MTSPLATLREIRDLLTEIRDLLRKSNNLEVRHAVSGQLDAAELRKALRAATPKYARRVS